MSRKILKTNDYEKFKFADFNRTINKANLKKLIKLGKESPRFHLFPIVVDKNNIIIDGQHRFEACKALGLPIFYIIEKKEDASVDLIYSLNVAGKKHTTEDKIRMLAKNGNRPAKTILELEQKYNRFKVTSLIEVSYMLKGSGIPWDKIESGECPNLMGIECVDEINRLPLDNISNRLCRAIMRLKLESEIDIDKIMDRLIKNRYMIFDGGREADVYKSLISAYNKGLRGKNKIRTAL